MSQGAIKIQQIDGQTDKEVDKQSHTGSHNELRAGEQARALSVSPVDRDKNKLHCTYNAILLTHKDIKYVHTIYGWFSSNDSRTITPNTESA